MTTAGAPREIWAWTARRSRGREDNIWAERHQSRASNAIRYVRGDLAPDWQPIETAPDDRDFLAIERVPGFEKDIVQVCARLPELGIVSAWDHRPFCVPGESDPAFNPTHWIPLWWSTSGEEKTGA
ncbi:MAG: hypothetical protein F4Y03_16090 [Alphaproteobacteria bacterium]|nr:hypothetical protein [Alphaproteobacteria bacterium]